MKNIFEIEIPELKEISQKLEAIDKELIHKNPKLVYLTKQQICEAYGFSLNTVDKWIRERALPFRKIGKNVRINLQELIEFFDEHTIQPK